MAAKKSSRVNPRFKTKYRVRNWPDYERGLRRRGDVTIWLSEEAVQAWTPPKTGCRGGQPRYSNVAIVTALTLRVVFHLALRQTEGFLNSLFRLLDLELRAPDHTTLSRRGRDAEVPPLRREHDGAIHLIVDSSGLRVFGTGDWHGHRYPTANRRRGWRKLHIGVDEDGFLVAAKLTSSREDDAATLPDLLEQVDAPVDRFTADGAYDERSVYDHVGMVGTPDLTIVIPPRRDAVPSEDLDSLWTQRDAALERIDEVGRRGWQKEAGYRQQAKVENQFYRYKRVLGARLQARYGDGQTNEAMVGCHVLNRMFELGKPDSYPVAAAA